MKELNIKELISQMTLEEKIGQMTQCYMDEGNGVSDELREMIQRGEVGSVILSSTSVAGNVEEKLAFHVIEDIKEAEKKSRLQIPVLLGRDIIHGHKIIFPIPLAQAASWNMELIEKAAELTAKEARMDGVEWTFAPALDLSRDPRWGRIIESYGEDPYLGSRVAEANVKGTEKVMLSCAKHFVCYGAVEGGRDYSQSQVSDNELYNMYLPAFRAAVNAGCSTVMNSFSAVNGLPCAANRELMRDVLKNDIGFDGFVVSDWGSPKWLVNHGVAENDADCAELSIKAGIDMEMATDTYRKSIKQLIADGKLTEDILNECVARILLIKQRFAEKWVERTDNEELLAAAEAMSDETMILLKNENHTLPLAKEGKILLTGPYATERRSLCGSWCSGDFEKTVTLYEGIRAVAPCVDLVLADGGAENEKLIRRSKAEIAIVALGEPAGITGERSSVADIRVPQAQIAALRNCRKWAKKVVTVIFGGRPLGIAEVAELSDAVLYAWHSGMTCGKSAAKILFGDCVPSGKTPVSFLYSSGQIPMYYNMPHLPIPTKDDGVPLYYGEPVIPSYNDEYSHPLYPFGFGLSYTEFAYSNLRANRNCIAIDQLKNGEKINISVDVENIGDLDAKEVVQMYIHANKFSIMRPMRELKGFRKLLIRREERQTVTFSLGIEELGYYVQRKLRAEKGKYDVWVGGSCYADEHLVIEIQ